MKKAAAVVLASALIFCLAGCNGTQSESSVPSSTPESVAAEKIKVVATIFPEYDWARNIIGEDNESVELSYLLGNGVDLHSFQPTADDIITISDCDIFIYVGGESDQWVTDVLKNADNSEMKVVNLMDILGTSAKEEEIKEGMQAEDHDHDHGSDHDHDSGEESEAEEKEYDEHVWLSLRNAEMFCEKISDALCEKDPDQADMYKENLKTYTDKLDTLDKKFTRLTSESDVKTLIFADRFPFRYFTDDYGLNYYAAFTGCSAESEASFETIAFLAQKTDELGCDTIYTIENSDGTIARTVVNSTKTKDQKIAVLNSIQSVTNAEIDKGAAYLDIMEENYSVLEKSFGKETKKMESN